MATPSATPAAPASTNAPAISSAVAHAWTSHGMLPDQRAGDHHRARQDVLADAEARRRELPEDEHAGEQDLVHGARAASHARMSGHRDGDGVGAHVGLVDLDAEARAVREA